MTLLWIILGLLGVVLCVLGLILERLMRPGSGAQLFTVTTNCFAIPTANSFSNANAFTAASNNLVPDAQLDVGVGVGRAAREATAPLVDDNKEGQSNAGQ